MERSQPNDPSPHEPSSPARAELREGLHVLERALLAGPGTVPAVERQAAARGDASPAPLGPYLERVRTEAHAVTDQEVADLRRTLPDDTLFELTICAAFGAARRQLDAGLSAVAAAFEEEG